MTFDDHSLKRCLLSSNFYGKNIVYSISNVLIKDCIQQGFRYVLCDLHETSQANPPPPLLWPCQIPNSFKIIFNIQKSESIYSFYYSIINFIQYLTYVKIFVVICCCFLLGINSTCIEVFAKWPCNYNYLQLYTDDDIHQTQILHGTIVT